MSEDDFPPSWECRLTLGYEDVWYAFLLNALLLDHEERQAQLEVAHDAPSQVARLEPVLRERNERMMGPGQEFWDHACDLCCWVSTDANGNPREPISLVPQLLPSPITHIVFDKGQLRSHVVDGVTIGHPCCGQHNCPVPLRSVKDHYCPEHHGLNRICSVLECEAPADTGSKTCSIPEHRGLETYYQQQGKAMFQLKLRLERARAKSSSLSLPIVNDPDPRNLEETVIESAMLCGDKPPQGNQQLKARFGRRWTHNDELCTASCGVIIGRVTFMGSEAPNGVRVSSQHV